jgi:hypothetical protein
MRAKVSSLFVALAAAQAASIHGTVTDYDSGLVLSRALVEIEPATGTPGRPDSVRTDRYGNFEFHSMAEGAYYIRVSRRYYVPVEYGQKRWNSAGMPVAVTEDKVPFLDIRLFRYGALAGAIVDENNVGVPEMEVAAYRNTRPPQLIATTAADERGAFRVYGLEPGFYLLRSLGSRSGEGSFLPTFAHETLAVDQAYPSEVTLGHETGGILLRPTQGTVFTLRVDISHPPDTPPVTLTLVSEMFRKTLHSYNAVFSGLVPGPYEIIAESEATPDDPKRGLYAKISIDRDTSLTYSMAEVRPTSFSLSTGLAAATDIRDFQALARRDYQVLARRNDLAGTGPTVALNLEAARALLPPGPWQLALLPPAGFYVQSFSGPGPFTVARGQRADGWNDIVTGGSLFGFDSVRWVLSANCGSVRGVVKSEGAPAAGAPVFLENLDLPVERRILETYATRADMQGRYRITGLAPGNYRVLASFGYLKVDSSIMSAANTRSFTLEGRTEAVEDLDLYVVP